LLEQSRVPQLIVTANVLPTSPILFIMMMEVARFSVTSILKRTTWRDIPEDGILQSYRLENFKSYIALTG
jgi:hypothetical protein